MEFPGPSPASIPANGDLTLRRNLYVILAILGVLQALIPVVMDIRASNIVLIKTLLFQSGTLLALVVFSLIWPYLQPESDRLLIGAVIGVLCAFGISGLGAAQPWAAAREGGTVICHLLLMWIILRSVRTEKTFIAILGCLVIGGLGVSTRAAFQAHGYDFVRWGMVPLPIVSSIGNAGFLESFLMMQVMVSAGILLARPPWLGRLMMPLAAVNLSISVYVLYRLENLTDTFGLECLMIFIPVFLVATYPSARMHRADPSRRAKLALGLTLAMLLVGGAVTAWFLSNPVKIPPQTDSFKKDPWMVRHVMWEGSVGMFRHHPIFGEGLGNFQLMFPHHRPDYYNRVGVSHNTQHPNSEYMEVLAETGAVGLSAYLFLFCLILSDGWFFLRWPAERWRRWAGAGIIAAILSEMVFDAFSVTLRWTSSSFLFWSLAGLFYALIRLKTPEELPWPEAPEEKRQMVRRVRHAALMSLFVAHAVWAYRIYESDRRLKFVEEHRADIQTAVDAGWKAIELNSYNLPAYYRLGYCLLTQHQETEALKVYDRLVSLAPDYAQVYQNIGLIHFRQGRVDSAVAAFERAAELHRDIDNYIKVAQLYKHQGRDTAAVRWIHRAEGLIEELPENKKEEARKNLVFLGSKQPQEASVDTPGVDTRVVTGVIIDQNTLVRDAKTAALKRFELDKTRYSPGELSVLENLYQDAKKKWGVRQAREAMMQIVQKYPGSNRAGCAMLELALKSEGEEKIKYLQQAIDRYGDCYFFNGVGVGSWARHQLAEIYETAGNPGMAEKLRKEIRENFPTAIDPSGQLLLK